MVEVTRAPRRHRAPDHPHARGAVLRPMSWSRDEMVRRAAAEVAARADREPRHRPADRGRELHPARRQRDAALGERPARHGPLPAPRTRSTPASSTPASRRSPRCPGASMFDSALSFAMIRGGHVDLAILGGLEVACNGDLANWTVPGKLITGMGGAMDLAAGARRVVVLQSHVSKDGAPKLVTQLTLPAHRARLRQPGDHRARRVRHRGRLLRLRRPRRRRRSRAASSRHRRPRAVHDRHRRAS